MKKKTDNLEQMKGKSPFSVPDDYMKNLTAQIMSQLPEQSKSEEKEASISFMSHVRPWLYMAAVFVGLILAFRVIVGIQETDVPNDALLVHTNLHSNVESSLPDNGETYDEDEDYFEYIENTYANYLIAEEMDFSE